MGLPRVSKKGFAYSGSRAQVLLFHGYTGSPYDLKPLALFLNQHDFAVSVPLLDGHGTKPADLARVSFERWLEQARLELAKLDPQRPIFLGGLSMGAHLAIIHASYSKAIKALLLFSPALSLKLSAELLISSARLGLISSDFSIPKLSGSSDVADPIAREKCPSYGEMPIKGLLEFDSLRMRARESLGQVHIPIFAGFGLKDNVINLKETQRYIAHTALEPVIFKFYARSQHVVTLDYDRELLYQDLINFINKALL